MQNSFEAIRGLSPIELDGMDSIRLMNRVDTKYLTDVNTLERVLEKIAVSGYSVFEVDGQRVHKYRSMYYDTPEKNMYLDHHNRRLVRQKLRTRCYFTGQVFLELKTKNNHGRTKKKRIGMSPEQYRVMSFDDKAAKGWLEERLMYPSDCLSPSLETVFSRITLVNPEKTERSTVDFDIRFNNVRNGRSGDMGNLVVIEVKQDANLPSRLREVLLECRVKQVRLSKYCIGTAMTDSNVRSGAFKEKIMTINKLKARI